MHMVWGCYFPMYSDFILSSFCIFYMIGDQSIRDFGGIVMIKQCWRYCPNLRENHEKRECVVLVVMLWCRVCMKQTLSQALPLAVNNPVFDLPFLFQTLMNEAAKGNWGFISDLHLPFNLENQSGAGAARRWAANVPGCLSKQSSASASSSVYVSPSAAHLLLSSHVSVTTLREGLLWILHSAWVQWKKIEDWKLQSGTSDSPTSSEGINGGATLPPSGWTKPACTCWQYYDEENHTACACFGMLTCCNLEITILYLHQI